jgi:hypothetical protein
MQGEDTHHRTRRSRRKRSHYSYDDGAPTWITSPQLIEGETTLRDNRRIRNARFPVLKTLEEFQWSWPRKINRPQIHNLFRLAFIATHANVVLIGNVGLVT